MDRRRAAYLERRADRLLTGRKRPRFAAEEAQVPPAMREALAKLDRLNRRKKLSPATRVNQLEAVVDLGLFLQLRRGRGRFEEATEKDFEAFQEEVPMPKSVADINRTVIRKFYWLLEGDGRGRRKVYPAKVDALEPVGNNGGEEMGFDPRKVPHYREMARHVDTLARTRNHPRDRALIWLTFDTGARLDEVVGLRVGDLKLPPGQHYGELTVHGKTGLRPVTFVRARPLLMDWLKVHPRSRDPEAPVWAQLKGAGLRGLSYGSAQKVFERAAKAAALPLSAHDLRHGRATEAAQLNWAEAKMRTFFGWKPGSKMPSRYVHLVGMDVRNQVLQDAGIEPEEKAGLRGLPKPCPNCGHSNPSIAARCGVCWFPLAPEEAEEVRAATEEPLKVVAERYGEVIEGYLAKTLKKDVEAIREEGRRYLEEYKKIQREYLPQIQEFMARVEELDRKVGKQEQEE